MKTMFLTVVLLISLSAFSQKTSKPNVQKTATGNYISLQKSKIKHDSITGKTFTDSKGKVYPVYKSVNNKLYVWRKSGKTGKAYKYYLKTA